MSWLQLELETNQVFGEELSVLLEEFGAISISLTASSDEPIFDEDAENNTLWDKTKLTALLNSKCDVDSLLIKLPEVEEIESLKNLKKLFEDNQLLDSNIVEVDLRIKGRAIIKVDGERVRFGLEEV